MRTPEIVAVREGATATLATNGSAAYDLIACIDDALTICPGAVEVVPAGVKVRLPSCLCGLVLSRSGLARRGVIVANAPGLIDPDYEGEVKVLLANIGEEPVRIPARARVAQLVFVPFWRAAGDAVRVVEAVRGEGGLGSTGLGVA